MLRAKLGDVAIDRGDEVLAAAGVGASVGGTVPSPANFFVGTDLQEALMTAAEVTARHGNRTTALPLVGAGSMFRTEVGSATIRLGHASVTAAWHTTRHVSLTRVLDDGRVLTTRFDGAGVLEAVSARIGTAMAMSNTACEMGVADSGIIASRAVALRFCAAMVRANEGVRHPISE